jgi:hypothetical protein
MRRRPTTLTRPASAKPSGYHVDVDGVREMVSSGLASPLAWTEETTRQFDLAIRGAAALARVYADAGFAVAIEGGIEPDAIEAALAAEGLRDRMVGIVLRARGWTWRSGATASGRTSGSTPRSWRARCGRSTPTSPATPSGPAGRSSTTRTRRWPHTVERILLLIGQ